MIKPLPGYVLIEPLDEDQKTSGGVYLPDSSKDKPCKGKVVSVGIYCDAKDFAQYMVDGKVDLEGVFKYGCNVKGGDTVVYKKWTNQEVDHEGKKYLLVKFDELLGIIE